MINSREEWFLTTLTNLQIVAITEREIPFTTLSPGQTLATFQRNILQHCWAQHVAHLWPPCYSMSKMVKFFSQHFECCMMLYSFGHVRATLLRRRTCTCSVCANQHVATGWPNVCNMLGHVVPNNVAICCVEMLRAFGQLLHNILQYDPMMLRYVTLKDCERLAGALS